MNLSLKLDMNLLKAVVIADLIVSNASTITEKLGLKLDPMFTTFVGGAGGFLVGALMNDQKIKTLSIALAGTKIINDKLIKGMLSPASSEPVKQMPAQDAKVFNLQDYGYLQPVGLSEYINLPAQSNNFQQYYMNN